jgi:hypothetical protein
VCTGVFSFLNLTQIQKYVVLVHTNLRKFITPTPQAEYGMMRSAAASKIHPDYPFRWMPPGVFSDHPSITDDADRIQKKDQRRFKQKDGRSSKEEERRGSKAR